MLANAASRPARFAAAVVLLAAHTAAAEKLTIERLFAAPDLGGATLRAPRFSPDGRYVAYLQGSSANKDRLDLWAYDTRRGRNVLLIDASELVPQERALSPEEEARRERQRSSSLSGIVEYEFSPDGRHILVPLSGDLYLYDLGAAAGRAVRRLTATDAFETDAHFSPLGRHVSFLRAQNLFAIELASGREFAITDAGGGTVSFGSAEFIAQEEMNRDRGYWWSPDERYIAYARVDEAPVDEIERFEIYADSVKVVRQRYPAAGRPNADVRLFLATPGGAPRAAREIELGAAGEHYLARVEWFPDGSRIAVQRQSRDQRRLELLSVDVPAGRPRTLITEQSPTWVDLNDELTFLPRTRRLIWPSSRSGYKHLYLYDYDGRLIAPLTSGAWTVAGDPQESALRGVDEARGRVYFMATKVSVLERHLYEIALPGAGRTATPRRITLEAGWHSAVMSRDARQFLDTYSNPDRPPSLQLRAASGRVLRTLVANELNADHPYAPYLGAHLATEFGTLDAADGQTLHYQIIRPAKLRPGKRYPVIFDLYGGPGVQRVRRSWGGYPRSNEGYFRQLLAQHGYVVFTLDNRGSAARGVAFETALFERLGTVEVADQVRGAEFLRTLPYIDTDRIGVFGWSYGGYLALMCLLRAPQVFQAAVAGAPVTDWSLYDTHYTERYMGTPAANPQGYRDSMVMTHAAALRGALLLMHGMADDNVLFSNSTALMKRLQDLGKPFDLMTYPGSKHGLLRFAVTGPHAYAAVLRHFDRTLGHEPR